MVDCEICGQNEATSRAKIDGVILSVCADCSKTGKIVEEPKAQQRTVPLSSKPRAEELVVSDFAKIISQARQGLGLKQEEFANKINEKLSTIGALESGKREPDLKLAKKLERFFGIKLIEEV
jgi:putative transcription factor